MHIESCYGYDFGDKGYARALLGDKQHWVRKLPGQLLQNIISHGTGRLAKSVVPYLPDGILRMVGSVLYRHLA